jgi:hypothetical protein
MDEPSSTSSIRLSDPVTLTLIAARMRLRSARVQSEEQGDSVKQRALITTALDAVQDALDMRDES